MQEYIYLSIYISIRYIYLIIIFIIDISIYDATCNKCGIRNISNEHFWACENPHALKDGSCRMVHRHILPMQCNST